MMAPTTLLHHAESSNASLLHEVVKVGLSITGVAQVFGDVKMIGEVDSQTGMSMHRIDVQHVQKEEDVPGVYSTHRWREGWYSAAWLMDHCRKDETFLIG